MLRPWRHLLAALAWTTTGAVALPAIAAEPVSAAPAESASAALAQATALAANARSAEPLRKAMVLLHDLVDREPLAREAEAAQRSCVRLADRIAAFDALQPRKGQGVPSASAADAEAPILERRKYLALVAQGGPWLARWQADAALTAEVAETAAVHGRGLALLLLGRARQARAAGDEAVALQRFAEAAAAFEAAAGAPPRGTVAEELTLAVAETWVEAARACDGLRSSLGELEVALGPPVHVVPLPDPAAAKQACPLLGRGLAVYERLAADPAAVGQSRQEAAWRALQVQSRLLTMRAALPVGDPERLEMRDVPELRPWEEEEEADIEAMRNEVVVRKVTPRPLRPEAVAWLLAADAYVRAWPGGASDDPSRAVAVAFQAAEFLHKHRQFDPNPALATDRTPAGFWSARERFWWIIKQHPQVKQAVSSFQYLLTSYAIENDIANLQVLVEAMTTYNRPGSPPRDKRIHGLVFPIVPPGAGRLWEKAESTRKAAARMTNPDEAGKQFAESREYYEQAGDKFRHLRADATDTKTKLGALMWGMESFRRAEKWDKCLDVLNEAEEMIRGVKAADQAERKENVKRLDLIITTRALLNYRFFRIPEAIADYRLLYENNPDGARASEYLKSAADLALYNGDWDLAVKLDEAFVAKFGRDPKKRDLVQQPAWRIQQSWQKKGNSDRQLKALEAFIARFAGDAKASNRVFRAYSLIGEIYEARGDRKNAERTWSRTLVAFQRGGYPKNGGAEPTAAAQATFKQLEPRHTQVMTTKLEIDPRLRPIGQARRLLGQLRALWDLVLGPEKQIAKPDGTMATARGGGLYDEYETVLGFGSREWSPAASLYRARLLQHLARVLYEMPVPDKLPPKEVESFGLTVAAIVGKPFEDRALSLLETALNDADAKGVANRWVTELRKQVNRYKPKQYPLLKEEKRLLLARPGPLPVAPAPAANDGTERATAAAGVRAAMDQVRAGDLPAALASAAKAVQADPAHSRAVVLWSVLLLRAGDTQAALKAVDAAQASRPTDVMLLNAKVRVLTSSGEFAKAREVTVRTLKLDHTNPETLLQIAEIDLARGREGLANLALDRAFSVYAGDADDDDGEDPDGEPETPRKAYDVRVAQGGGDLRGTGAETLGRDAGMSRIYALYARIALGGGEHAEARQLLGEAVGLRPDDAEAWNNLGVCWLAARKGDEAVAALSKALELEPHLLEAHVNLGSAYRFTTDPDRVMKARGEFERVIRQAPRMPEPYFNLGILYLENAMPDLPSHERRYQKAIELFAAYRDARGPHRGPDPDPVDDYVAEAIDLRRTASQAP